MSYVISKIAINVLLLILVLDASQVLHSIMDLVFNAVLLDVRLALRLISVTLALLELLIQLKEFVFNLAILLIVLPVLIVYVLNAILEILSAVESVLPAQSTTASTALKLTCVNNAILTINSPIIPAFFAVLLIAKLAMLPTTAQPVLLTIT